MLGDVHAERTIDVRCQYSDSQNPAPRVQVTAGAFLALVRKGGYNSQYSFGGDERERKHEEEAEKILLMVA